MMSPSLNFNGYDQANRVGFTLLEIIASLMLMTFGLSAVIGMVLYAQRVSGEYQNRATALATAESVLFDYQPIVINDGAVSSLTWNSVSAGGNVEGWINGYYLYRQESSAVIAGDDRHDLVTITVHVYAGEEDQYLTSVRRRLIRRK